MILHSHLTVTALSAQPSHKHLGRFRFVLQKQIFNYTGNGAAGQCIIIEDSNPRSPKLVVARVWREWANFRVFPPTWAGVFAVVGDIHRWWLSTHNEGKLPINKRQFYPAPSDSNPNRQFRSPNFNCMQGNKGVFAGVVSLSPAPNESVRA